MASSKKITSQEVIQDNIFESNIKSAEAFDVALKNLIEGLKLTKKESDKFLKDNKNPATAKQLSDVNNKIEESVKLRKALNDVEKLKVKLDQQKAQFAEKENKTTKTRIQLTDKEIKQAEVRKILEKQRITSLKALAVLESNQLGLETKLVASNTLLRIQREKLNVADKNYAKDLAKINSQIDKNNALINKNADQLKQQKINVGNYTRSIHSAINETGIFNSTLGNLIVSLRGLVVSQDAAATGAARFGNVLKATGIGLIIAAIAGLTSAIKANQNALDGLSIITGKVKDFFTQGRTNYAETAKALIELRNETLKYKLALQDLALDEEDFRKRSDDVTLSFSERNKALKEAEDLQKKIAELNVSQAKKELDLLKNQIDLNGRNADDLEKINEAQLKYNDALDKQSDLLTIDIPLAIRKRKGEELQAEIDLLIGKKTSATAQLTLLNKQANDEKGIIDERKAAYMNLQAEIDKNFNLQIETFNKYSNVILKTEQARKLLAATSKEELSKELLALGLNVAEQNTLATIITKTQNAQIEAGETKNKIIQDELDLKNRIAEIDREISKLKRDDAIYDKEITLKQEQEKTNLLEQQVLAGNEKIDILKEQRTIEQSIENEIIQKRREDLTKQRNDDVERTKEKTLQKEEETAELLKIETKYQIDLENLDEEGQRLHREQLKKELDFQKQINRQKTEVVLGELSKVTAATSAELDKRSEREQEAFDRSIDKRKETIDRQKDLAAQGLDNELAFQEAKLAKEELARKEAQEKADREKEIAQLTEAYFNFLNARLSQPGANPLNASALAASDTFLAKGVAKGLVQFALEGNEDVQPLPGMKATKGKDSIPFLLAPGEGVVTEEGNKSNPGVVKALNKGVFDKMFMPRMHFDEAVKSVNSSTAENIYNSMLIQQNSEILKTMKKIEAKPVQKVDVDGLKGIITETTYNSGMTTKIYHKLPVRKA